ncbi:alpha/beta-hydrolase [Apiospora saccharicola]|uniref:Alpha/beta-hydrolase n=1 Tax=Apiospora saccharicola TaxID=335842 RepID=A0ABR1U4L1_9PEZI
MSEIASQPHQNQMSGKKPTLLFLHGSMHTGQVWERVVPLLEARGYARCLTPQLCFCGTAEPVPSIAPCVAQVRALIADEIEAGRDVILINHSFAGIVGCSAVNGFTSTTTSPEDIGRVIGIIMLSAFAIPSNTSALDFIRAFGGMTPMARPGPEGWDVLVKDPLDAFYHDLAPEDADLWHSRLQRQSSTTRTSAEGVYAGWKDDDVPVWFVVTRQDRCIPSVFQERMIDMMDAEGMAKKPVVRRVVDSGHSPMLSQPEVTASVIEEAVEAMVAGKPSIDS